MRNAASRIKEETLYSDLDELEETPKTEFSDQEIEEESEKVIDEAKKLLNPDEKEEKEVFLQEEKKKKEKKMRIQTQSRNS